MESWQEYGDKIERAYEARLAEMKTRPDDRQIFSAIRRQFVRGAAFLTESTKLIMVICQDMESLIETAEQGQKEREEETQQRKLTWRRGQWK